MTATLTTTESDFFAVLGNWIEDALPNGFEAIKGQVNRVPTPRGPNWAVMTPISRSKLSTNLHSYLDDPGTPANGRMTIKPKAEVTIQVDVFGPNASDNAQILASLFADEQATLFFSRAGVEARPLYAEDPRQTQFINEKDQYEDRWTLSLHLQVNPTILVFMDFADQLKVTLINVDTSYPLQ